MMIDYSRITDPTYYKSIIHDINRIDDTRVLSDLLKQLSGKIAYSEVSPTTATMVLEVIKSRMKVLTTTRGSAKNNANRDKRMTLTPTSISNRAGAVAVALLITNVAIVSIMYTLLWIASSIK